MKYFSVKNLNNFQHYKERNPPWIKLHQTILEDYEFATLSEPERLHLIMIWLIASRSENRLPYDAAWISARINAKSKVNIERLASLGFIVVEQSASVPLATCVQNADSEERRGETEKRRDRVLTDFEKFWTAYPKKTGKGAARNAWKKLRPSGEVIAAILAALDWQARSDQWTKDAGQFIPNPSTYLNQERWLDQPTAKAKKESATAGRYRFRDRMKREGAFVVRYREWLADDDKTVTKSIEMSRRPADADDDAPKIEGSR